MKNKKYVQYGCGLSAPSEWINYDVSPTLRLQRLPLVGFIFKKIKKPVFPENIKYGDIIKGLPEKENSCDGIYCSHTLEHLSLEDFRKALGNTHKILKPGGTFKCIVPDLEIMAREYLENLKNGETDASIKFVDSTLFGVHKRNKGLKAIINSIGNSNHLWMWDHSSLTKELEDAGFKNIKKSGFNESQDEMFKKVEDEDRFVKAVAIECVK